MVDIMVALFYAFYAPHGRIQTVNVHIIIIAICNLQLLQNNII